ncbi:MULTISPECIES: PIN domain-containing protein [Giesbergeria]|uniref:PIN domain-containing protein n=1 Tax=Giesbergeria sinuosa TaxID=80883 RepID=A0ABV9QE48_9BURK
MRINYVLIDYENVQAQSLHLLTEEHFRVMVFLGPTNTKLRVDFVLAMHQLGSRSGYVTVETSGTNALDFHIAYYLGNLAITDPRAYFHVISKDTGFDPLIQHLKSRKISCTRSPSIKEMPCFIEALTPKITEISTTTLPTPTPQKSIDSYLKLVVNDLINRNSSRPKSTKSLKNTIQSKLGKDTPAEITEQVYDLLISNHYAKINDEKVLYTLPTLT